MPTGKHAGEADSGHSPERSRKNNPLTSWTAILALLGAGAVPCPDCGLPLAWHLWPLALLILGARWIVGRKSRDPAEHPSAEPASVPDETRDPRMRPSGFTREVFRTARIMRAPMSTGQGTIHDEGSKGIP